ncbi:hypothetical protein B0A48_16261 [Cryoendolithus antarcticus]|uniref:Glycosyl transferase CAP10 domain-containing protein n=1 Tax=Cryoendolithus antarcticus TaxID=1507870 RepID=A0A1V8SFP9_9PEZI|nr:hypothetical protein B0A48_16261 [Cryoendolithus antarcticus]
MELPSWPPKFVGLQELEVTSTKIMIVDLVALDDALQLISKYSTVDAIPSIEAMEYDLTVFHALQWYRFHGRKEVDDFLYKSRGRVLTEDIVVTLPVGEQQVLAWEKAKPKMQSRDLSARAYRQEIKNKPFRLMDLPAELRNRIYRYFFKNGDKSHIDIHRKAHDKRHYTSIRSRLNLTYVSKQLRAETRLMFWHASSFHFAINNASSTHVIAGVHTLNNFMGRLSPDCEGLIQSIVLSYDNSVQQPRAPRRRAVHVARRMGRDDLFNATIGFTAIWRFDWDGGCGCGGCEAGWEGLRGSTTQQVAMRTLTLYSLIFGAITTVLLIAFTTTNRSHYVQALDPLDADPSLTRPPHPPIAHHKPRPHEPWTYPRDARNYGLSEDQCTEAFPDLYVEIDRAVAHRKKIGNITLDELDVGWRGDGIVRAMIHDNQLYVINAAGVWDHNHRPRAIGTLHSLHRAISAYPDPLPDIEFTFVTHDDALRGPDDKHTTWTYTRLPHQESIFLIPDFGFWGWPDVGIRSYSELQSVLAVTEEYFIDKRQQLVWRGAIGGLGSSDVREGLVKASKNKPWADVQVMEWHNATDIAAKLLSMEQHCGYMFLAQTEGNSYSGRLKFLLNCHSVLLSHPLKWVEHFHHLLLHEGGGQNYIRTKQDFSDLPSIMAEVLAAPDTIMKAKRIADNSRRVFRERYLTPAAEACYWRALIRGWASVQGFEVNPWREEVGAEHEGGLVDDTGKRRGKGRFRGVPFEGFAIMEEVQWEIPAKWRHLCVEE